MIVLDDYVVDVLMRDLVGHDHIPRRIWCICTVGRSERHEKGAVAASHQMIAEATGLPRARCRRACGACGKETACVRTRLGDGDARIPRCGRGRGKA